MTREVFVQIALKYLDYPSINCKGNPELGCDPSGFDCSGFISFVLKEMGLFLFDPPIRHVSVFFDHFGVFVHEEYAERGDLIFFSRNGVWPSHMGILVNTEEYVHAPGVKNSQICIARIIHKGIVPQEGAIYDSNPIGYKRLSTPQGRWQSLLS